MEYYEQAISPYSLEELLVQIRSRYQDKIQENGIEFRGKQKTSIG